MRNIELNHDGVRIDASLDTDNRMFKVAGSPVTTNVGGLSNMVIDQSSGLVAMPDATALAAKLRQYLEQPALAKQMAQQGYQLAQQSFSLSRWQQQWLEYLAKL